MTHHPKERPGYLSRRDFLARAAGTGFVRGAAAGFATAGFAAGGFAGIGAGMARPFCSINAAGAGKLLAASRNHSRNVAILGIAT